MANKLFKKTSSETSSIKFYKKTSTGQTQCPVYKKTNSGMERLDQQKATDTSMYFMKATGGYDPQGVHYIMKSHNDGQYTTGYGNHTKIMRTVGIPYKYPLVINLDEPIVKTNEQTFKITLNVEIE